MNQFQKDNKYPPIIVVGGPTASGKSSLGLRLAKKFEGVVVNADSKQVYKELRIGTARPVPNRTADDHWLINGVKHYLYGHVSIYESYDVHRYQKEFFSLIKDLSKNDPVFLVGGTGLYINSVIYNYGLQENKALSDRSSLETLTLEELQKKAGHYLGKLNESDKRNPRRLIRMIEKGCLDDQNSEPLPHLFMYIEVRANDLREVIIKRTERMFIEGLLEEASTFEKEISAGYPSFNIIGYKEFKGFFSGELELDEVKELIITHTMQYAKRQRTWFRNKTEHRKIRDYEAAETQTSNFLTSYN